MSIESDVSIQPIDSVWYSRRLHQLSFEDRGRRFRENHALAEEYVVSTHGLGYLAVQNSVMKAIIANDTVRNPDIGHVYAGIEGGHLLAAGELLDSTNPRHDHLRGGFCATQVGHWASVIGEAKMNPFKYAYGAEIPVIVGFDMTKLESNGGPSDNPENVCWKPSVDETVQGALVSVYWLNAAHAQ